MKNKDVLRQYKSLKVEIQELECRIRNLEEYQSQVESDIVRGSCSSFPYNEVSFHIEGYNIEEEEKKIRRIRKLQSLLQNRISKCEDVKIDIEEFINDIPDSLTRRVFKYRYIEELSWQAIAMRIGKVHESYPRKYIHDKYLNSL